MSQVQILVVDDCEMSIRLITYLLDANGYRVDVAHNADEARACIAARRPRMILMDVQLPGTDGLTLTRELKADCATADIVIVAVTANAMRHDEQRALDAGCDAYLAKPVNVRTLPTTVATLLARGECSAG